MKKLFTTALICASMGVMAQTKPEPFSVPFKQSDLAGQQAIYQWLYKTLHGAKMDAMVRDTADNKLSLLFQLTQIRYREAFVADSVAKAKVKKP